MWPSRDKHSVGARYSFFEARFLARRCLCLHFTRRLAAPSAKHEVKMVRYSFPVGIFHPLLHAGLSRRLRSLTVTALRKLLWSSECNSEPWASFSSLLV